MRKPIAITLIIFLVLNLIFYGMGAYGELIFWGAIIAAFLVSLVWKKS